MKLMLLDLLSLAFYLMLLKISSCSSISKWSIAYYGLLKPTLNYCNPSTCTKFEDFRSNNNDLINTLGCKNNTQSLLIMKNQKGIYTRFWLQNVFSMITLEFYILEIPTVGALNIKLEIREMNNNSNLIFLQDIQLDSPTELPFYGVCDERNFSVQQYQSIIPQAITTALNLSLILLTGDNVVVKNYHTSSLVCHESCVTFSGPEKDQCLSCRYEDPIEGLCQTCPPQKPYRWQQSQCVSSCTESGLEVNNYECKNWNTAILLLNLDFRGIQNPYHLIEIYDLQSIDVSLKFNLCNQEYLIGPFSGKAGIFRKLLKPPYSSDELLKRIIIEFFFFGNFEQNAGILIKVNDTYIDSVRFENGQFVVDQNGQIQQFQKISRPCFEFLYYLKIRVAFRLELNYTYNSTLSISSNFTSNNSSWALSQLKAVQLRCPDYCKSCDKNGKFFECKTYAVLLNGVFYDRASLGCSPDSHYINDNCFFYQNESRFSEYLISAFTSMAPFDQMDTVLNLVNQTGQNFIRGSNIYTSSSYEKRVFGGPFVWSQAAFSQVFETIDPHFSITVIFRVYFASNFTDGEFRFQLGDNPVRIITKSMNHQWKNFFGDPPKEFLHFAYDKQEHNSETIDFTMECYGINNNLFDAYCGVSDFYLVINKCQPFCLSCIDDATCQSWNSSYDSNIHRFSQNECQENEYHDSRSYLCIPCSINCLTCLSPTYCTSCLDTFYKFQNNCICHLNQYIHTENDINSCQDCPTICKHCRSNDFCLDCYEDQLRIIENGQCICQPGYYDDLENTLSPICSPCHVLCLVCTSMENGSCSSCRDIPHLILVDGFCQCQAGYLYSEDFIRCFESNLPSPVCAYLCGDGIRCGDEICDDGNNVMFDGCQECQFQCQEECIQCVEDKCVRCIDTYRVQVSDWTCIPLCGDGIVVGDVQCDDQNNNLGDFCDGQICKLICRPDCLLCENNLCIVCPEGFNPYLNECRNICGDLKVVANYYRQEQCDDGNFIDNDCCSSSCNWQCQPSTKCTSFSSNICQTCSPKYQLNGSKNKCKPLCGDGFAIEDEICDDGNNSLFDGCHQCKNSCQPSCQNCLNGKCSVCRQGYKFNLFNMIYLAICGDKIVQEGEECDDGNSIFEDGCHQCRFTSDKLCYMDIRFCQFLFQRKTSLLYSPEFQLHQWQELDQIYKRDLDYFQNFNLMNAVSIEFEIKDNLSQVLLCQSCSQLQSATRKPTIFRLIRKSAKCQNNPCITDGNQDSQCLICLDQVVINPPISQAISDVNLKQLFNQNQCVVSCFKCIQGICVDCLYNQQNEARDQGCQLTSSLYIDELFRAELMERRKIVKREPCKHNLEENISPFVLSSNLECEFKDNLTCIACIQGFAFIKWKQKCEQIVSENDPATIPLNCLKICLEQQRLTCKHGFIENSFNHLCLEEERQGIDQPKNCYEDCDNLKYLKLLDNLDALEEFMLSTQKGIYCLHSNSDPENLTIEICNQTCQTCNLGRCLSCAQGYYLNSYDDQCYYKCGQNKIQLVDILEIAIDQAREQCIVKCSPTLALRLLPGIGDCFLNNEDYLSYCFADRSCPIFYDEYCLTCENGFCVEWWKGFKVNPSTYRCEPIGGDLIVMGNEQCDDGNSERFDGCHECMYNCYLNCRVCSEFICLECDKNLQLVENECVAICGDGKQQLDEQCDDGNNVEFDGCYKCKFDCFKACRICSEGHCLDCPEGYYPVYNRCDPKCGDGIVIQPIEQCDDANVNQFDGCSERCEQEDNWFCFSNVKMSSLCYFDPPPVVQIDTQLIDESRQIIYIRFDQQLEKIPSAQQQNLILILKVYLGKEKEYVPPQIAVSYFNYSVNLDQDIDVPFSETVLLMSLEFYHSSESWEIQLELKQNKFFNKMRNEIADRMISLKLPPTHINGRELIKATEKILDFNELIKRVMIGIAIFSAALGNFDILWNVLEMVQQFSLLKYVNVQFPKNMDMLLNSFEAINAAFFIEQMNLQKIQEQGLNYIGFTTETYQASDKFEAYEQQGNFYHSIANYTTLFGIFFFQYLFFKAFKQILLRFQIKRFTTVWVGINHHLKKIVFGYTNMLEQSGLYRFYTANFFDMQLQCLLQIVNGNEKPDAKVVTYIAYAIFLTQSVIPLKIAYKDIKMIKYLGLKKRMQQGELQGIIMNGDLWIINFHVLNLIKKNLLVIILVALQNNPLLQTLMLSLLSVSFNSYLLCVQPMNGRFQNLIAILHSSCHSLVYITIVTFSKGLKNSYEKGVTIAWVGIGCLMLIILTQLLSDAISQIFLIQELLRNIISRWKKKGSALNFISSTHFASLVQEQGNPVRASRTSHCFEYKLYINTYYFHYHLFEPQFFFEKITVRFKGDCKAL